MSKRPVQEPDTTNMVVLGQYVANSMIGGNSCHSADLKTSHEMEPEKTPGFYGGGTARLDMDGHIEVVTANITMDPTMGIDNRTEEEFVKAVRFGQKPGGGQLHYPMMPHAA